MRSMNLDQLGTLAAGLAPRFAVPTLGSGRVAFLLFI
ncbi:hypothetical protein PAECIP111892_02082 [Paenibacillus auburnensis]|uniref:Uncharacterized protein n=1 Tax=Paenibacillus auburnensis TaxID=2905649 RepID=A0ABN8G0E7_9BACL|nr:hypothetical protein PAECIP111892_02082 [Paenibacillus auburnensis]